jgi:GTP-binding protein HflX
LQIYGDTSGLSPSERDALKRIYRRRVPADQLVSNELARALAEISHTTHRQVGALVQRTGAVEYVVIGDAAKLMLPELGRSRAGGGRFRGLRLVHTHLRGEPLTRDDLVDLTRLRLDLVVALCVSPEGGPQTVHYAHCVPVPDGSQTEPFRSYGPIPYAKLDCNPAQLIAALEEEFARVGRTRAVKAKDGRAILVHVCNARDAHDARASLLELGELARTAGVEVADTALQTRPHADPKYVLGRGKLEDTILRAMQLDVEVLIFDRELTPAQTAAISLLGDVRVLDRTQLILDIFAQHAHSADGKLQVELAQTRYLLPHLGQKDDALSRLTGGIGGRGPGETKIEVGKRRARERISVLETRLKRSAKQRGQRRALRGRHGVAIVAIVGYTNAGKSTLLNRLTASDVYVANELFATLDPTSRRLRFPKEREAIITDTVGFIRDLPPDLVKAFRATLEELEMADLLLHVIDVSDPMRDEKMQAVDALLDELHLGAIPRLIVFNKTDRVEAWEARALARKHNGVAVSAAEGSGLEPLVEAIAHRLWQSEAPLPDPDVWPTATVDNSA